MVKPEGFIQTANPLEVLFQAHEQGKILSVQVTSLDYPDNQPTWVLAFPGLDGVRGLVPRGETGLDGYGDTHALMQRFVGQVVNVKIKGLDRENGLAACSRREAVDEMREKVLESLNEGQVIDCLVRAVLPRADGKPPRLLVDAGGGVLVEIPRKKAAVRLAVPLQQQYRPGQPVKARVLRVDARLGQAELSIRDALPDPWERADFRRGATAACTVVTVQSGIVFLEPDSCPGVTGIAPAPLVGELSRGNRVTAVVATFDRGAHKLRFRLRGRLA